MNPLPDKPNTASIIIANEGIPNAGMGSWTQIIDYLFNNYSNNQIKYLLCGPPAAPFVSAATTRIICNFSTTEINRKWFYAFKYRNYINALKEIIAKYDFVVIAIIDNAKLKNIVTNTIAQNGWQNKCRVIFVQCGFSYEFTRDEYKDFKKGLHEIVLLTQKSYLYELNKYHEYPFLAHVLHNPIRQDVFYPIPKAERQVSRQQLGVAATDTMFLWVSHDRPKKGLDVMIRMWPAVVAKYPAAQLFIVGAQRDIVLPGLVFVGKIPNLSIARYYQAADVFLFSSLCQEALA